MSVDGERKDELLELAEQVSALSTRLEKLENLLQTREPREARAAPPPPGELDLDLLQRLRSRTGPAYDEDGVRGAVLYAGASSSEGLNYVWQMERPVPGLLELEEAPLAQVLSALSNPARLKLLRSMLRGPRSSQQLQETLGNVSTGQFYHHLKELLSAGIVVQKERSRYEVQAHHVIPLLAILAAAYDLTNLGEAPP